MARRPKTLDEQLSTEIKQDIAERYFGFRKFIEEEKLDLTSKIKEYSFILQKRISFDLIRIYVLLKDEDLIQEFMETVNLDDRLFYDPYIRESPQIVKRVFECQYFEGWTIKGRYINFFLACYDNLTLHAELYRNKIEELEQEQGMITEEVKQFYKQNDISAIMGFLKKISASDTSVPLEGGLESGLAEDLDEKLKITPPMPIEKILPILPPLPPLAKVKGRLKKIVKTAYKRQPADLIEIFTRKVQPCKRRETD